MNDDRIRRAMELALSCRMCGSKTDATYDKESKIWTTHCDCGKTSKLANIDVISEARDLIPTIPKK